METSEATQPPQKQKPVCELTYLDVEAFYKYVTGTGKILPRRVTHLSAKEQRHITRQIKRARNLLLMQ